MDDGHGTSRRRTGARLRALRERLSLSRAQAARRCGLSRLQLASFELGYREVPDSVVASLARAYGVSAGEVVPSRSPSRLRVSDGEMAAGYISRTLPADAPPEHVLDEYLDFIRELRHAEALDEVPLRDADLEVLANALGGTPEDIEARLVELIHCTHEEARAIRRALLKRRLTVPAAGFVLGMGGLGTAFASAATGGVAIPDAPVVSATGERARSIELEAGSVGVADPPEPAPAPAAPAPASTEDRRGNDEITRTGEGRDWAEVIPPLVVTPEDPD